MAYLYRYFDAEERLLYIGTSINAFRRLGERIGKLSWFKDIKTVSLDEFSNMAKATAAEKAAIKREKPLFNVVHSTKKKHMSKRSDALFEYQQFLRRSLERRKRAILLKEKGLSYAAIGRELGITRQRARILVNGEG